MHDTLFFVCLSSFSNHLLYIHNLHALTLDVLFQPIAELSFLKDNLTHWYTYQASIASLNSRVALHDSLIRVNIFASIVFLSAYVLLRLSLWLILIHFVLAKLEIAYPLHLNYTCLLDNLRSMWSFPLKK